MPPCPRRPRRRGCSISCSAMRAAPRRLQRRRSVPMPIPAIRSAPIRASARLMSAVQRSLIACAPATGISSRSSERDRLAGRDLPVVLPGGHDQDLFRQRHRRRRFAGRQALFRYAQCVRLSRQGGFELQLQRQDAVRPRECRRQKRSDARQGDIVATHEGLAQVRGGRRGAAEFTPISKSALMADKTTVRIEGRRRASRRPSTDQVFRRPTTSCAIDSALVSPGNSIPNRCTSPAMPCCAGPSIMKSAAGCPGPVSFGRMPE